MPRLVRPLIPVHIKLMVARRQLGWSDMGLMDMPVPMRPRGLGAKLAEALAALKDLFQCEVLHLDHDPPLGARKKVFRKGVHVDYDPPANDPKHLVYRPKTEHQLKTNVRGEHGQHPDRVLITKNRNLERREAGTKPRPKASIKGLTFQQQRCRAGARCHCDRKQRKTCSSYRQ